MTETDESRHGDDVDRSDDWERMRGKHLRSPDERPASSARGVHHIALLCTDVERTIGFYQDILGFPLTELFENRDYQGSTHFFFDIGNGNALAFFDFPGLDLGPYAEVLGDAAKRSATSRWTITRMRCTWGTPSRRSQTSGVATL